MNEQLLIDFDKVDKQIDVLTKQVSTSSSSDNDKLLLHKATLNKVPPKSFLKKNTFYGNMYIPIEIIERMLSALFLSYSFKMNIPPIIEEGNIIFFMDVVVINPITNEKETFTGTSAVPIKPVHGQLRDIHPHIPAAKTYAIMNACKHIGRLFRAENDNITKVFDSYFDNKVKEKKGDVARDNMQRRLLKMIENKKTLQSLKKLSSEVVEFNDSDVSKAFESKQKELKK
ncbi:MAG: hypothetical protein ACW980_21785 [Promethearchaeota archaeon]|jgi:hypothetical protein